MPTYEYECPKGHTFEAFQKMTDEPVATCPECGGSAHRKISGGAGFLFKGEGFYITDYRSEAYKKKASAESGDGSSPSKKETDAGSSAKSDAGSSTKGDGGSGGSKGSGSKSDA